MLALTLQAVEPEGLGLRTVYPTIPPKVEYSLPPMGGEVAIHIKALTDWVEDHVADVLKVRLKRAGGRELL